MPARDEDAKGQWRHTQVNSPHVVSQRPDLQRLRQSERETEAGTHVELPELRTRHDRNLRAAINLRNLIMPAGRSRDGPGQEAMGQQGRRLRAGAILARSSFPSSRTGPGCRTGNGTLSPERTCRELRYDR